MFDSNRRQLHLLIYIYIYIYIYIDIYEYIQYILTTCIFTILSQNVNVAKRVVNCRFSLLCFGFLLGTACWFPCLIVVKVP